MTADRYIRPDWLTTHIFNPTVRWLTNRGVSLRGSRELRVVGRKSGSVRTTVVNLLDLDGRTYLVPRQATFARFTSSRSVVSWALRLRQAM